MFSKNKENPIEKKIIARNVIGVGTKIVGDLMSEGDFRIDGTIEGTLKTKGRVIIGQQGFIKGTIECTNADVEGRFSGDFIVSDTLTLKTTANVIGKVNVGKIVTESGATFSATCSMRGAVKELNNGINDEKDKQRTA